MSDKNVVWRGTASVRGNVFVYYTLDGEKFAEIYNLCDAGFRIRPWDQERGERNYHHPIGEKAYRSPSTAEYTMCQEFGLEIVDAEGVARLQRIAASERDGVTTK